MPYKNIEHKRKNARERQRRYRADPAKAALLKKRRKELRDLNADIVKKKAQDYYKKNKDHILERTKRYHSENPQVKKLAQQKATALGKGVKKGKIERSNLSTAYIAAQIRKEKTKKTIEQKQAEILIYRLKKAIKKHE